MIRTLKDDWEIGDAWGKRYRGKFQVDHDGTVIPDPFNGRGSSQVITRTYKVLPLRGHPGIIKVSFEYKGEQCVGFAYLCDHLSDPESEKTRESRLAQTVLGQ